MKTLMKQLSTICILLVLASFTIPAFAAGTLNVDQADVACVTGTQVDPYSVVYCNIGDAVLDATDGDTVVIAAGTYLESLDITTDNLTLMGVDRDTVVIDASAISDYGIWVKADNVTIQDLTIDGPDVTAYGYGIKAEGKDGEVRAAQYNITIENVLVQNSGRSGIDLNGITGASLTDIVALNNGANGVAFTDTNNIMLTNVTTSGNPWGGVALYTYGRYFEGGIDGFYLLGTNSFAETNPLYIEVANYTDPGNPYPVQDINQTDFAFTVFNMTDTPAYTFFRIDAAAAISSALAMTTPSASYIHSEIDGSFLVADGMTIMAAVNAIEAAGTINIQAGTYEEQVVVDGLDVVLQGAGSGTIIQSPVTLIEYWAASTNNYPIVFALNHANLELNDLVVDGLGRGNANYRFIGVSFYNSQGALTNVEIANIMDTPFSGAQHGVALYAYNPEGGSQTITIDGVSVHDYQKNGLTFYGEGLVVDINGSDVTGAGPTSVTAQNGIQMSSGVLGSVSNTMVTGNSYTGGYWVATGMLLWSADVDLANNLVTENQVGVYHIDGSGTYTENTINITAAGVGVTDFWGVISDDPPQDRLPSVLDPVRTVEETETSLLATTQSVAFYDNTFTSDGSAGGVGLEIDAGYSNLDMQAVIESNTFDTWGFGIALYLCQSGCTGRVFDTIDIHYNQIINNTQSGLWVNHDYLVDATTNWWGDASGPSGEGAGTGDAIVYDTLGNVLWDPWCTKADCSSTSDFAFLFEADFEEGDFSEWTRVNDGGGWLTVCTAGAINGNYGACVASGDNDKRKQLIDDTPVYQTTFNARFNFDPNGLSMGEGERFRFVQVKMGEERPFFIVMQFRDGKYLIQLNALLDDLTKVKSNWFVLSDAPHTIEVDWQAASGIGANNGYAKMYVDDVLLVAKTGLDNDTIFVQTFRLGFTSRLDGKIISGVFYIDDVATRNDDHVGLP